jgi:transposase InsO family protein
VKGMSSIYRKILRYYSTVHLQLYPHFTISPTILTPTLRPLLSKFQLPFSTTPGAPACSACLSSKSHQQSFSHVHTRSLSPLELIYTDVWGPSPICSSAGFKYYVSFLDDFSRYTWIFPIACKSDVSAIFNQFKLYVERYFSCLIKTVQSDWGGEYRSLSKILQQHGITHRLSCPHTHQQNGAVERKHRHIVETGLALLSFASIPRHFWDDAFVTACYLINRMPTPTLKNQSPFEVLFKTPPDYKFLRIFGCACWPHLRPYNTNKLQPRSTQCVFMGYSLRHKGYKCLHRSTGRIYFSRDVLFQEDIFPFASVSSPSTASDSYTSSPRLPVSHPSAIVVHPSISSREQSIPLSHPSSLFPHEAPPTSPCTTPHPPLPDTSPPTSPCTTPHPSSPHSTSEPSLPLCTNSSPAAPILPISHHPMTTRSKLHISKPTLLPDGTPKYPPPHALLTATNLDDFEPTCYSTAIRHPKWREAMNTEFDALLKNQTWQLVPFSTTQNIIGCKLFFGLNARRMAQWNVIKPD